MCLKVRDFEEMVTQVFEEIHVEIKTSKKYVFLLVCAITFMQLVEQTAYFSSGPILEKDPTKISTPKSSKSRE